MGHGPALLTRFIRRLADDRVAAPTTAELLDRFVASRDEDAFRSIVDRHGPMVWGVCSRILRQPQDIEDAFQVTFIVLARRAAVVRPSEMLPAWLHGVARRSAIRVMRLSARRREVQVNTMPNPAANLANDLVDLPVILDEELGRLPPKLRQTVVLCHLQNRTYADAAREMGCSIASVAKRLDQAAVRLRDRLTRRGLAPVACTAWALAAWAPEAAAVSAGVADRTIAAALGVGAGAAATPVAVAAANDIVGSMTRFKLRFLAVALALAGVGATAAVQFTAAPVQPELPPPRAAAPVRGDRFGDPLPDGAVARIGTVRFRTGKTPCAGGVGFLAGGKTVVAAYWTGSVVFWDAATGRETARLDGPPGVAALAVSADGRRLVVAGKEIWAWDVTPQGVVSLWKKPSPNGARVDGMALSPDGKTLVCGSRTGGHLFDAATGDLLKPLAVKSPRLMAFAAGGRALVVAGEGSIHVYDPATGDERRQIHFPERVVVQLAVAPDGSRVAAAGGKSFWIWDAATGRELATVSSGSGDPAIMLFSPTTALFFSPDGRILFDVDGERIHYRDPATGSETRPAVTAPHAQSRTMVIPAVSPDGKLMAFAIGGAVGVWRTDTGAEIGPAGGPYADVTSLAFTPDGQNLVTAAFFNHFEIWNPATGAPVRRLTVPASGLVVGSLVVAPSGEVETVFSRYGGNAGNRVGVAGWNPQTGGSATDRPGVPSAVAKARTLPTPAAALSADGRRVVWAHETALVAVDWATGAEIRRVDTKMPVAHPTVSADGETAAAYATKEGVASVWDLGTGRERMRVSARLTGSTLGLSPDGRWLAGVEGDPKGPRAIQLWEVASTRSGPRFPFDHQAVVRLAFSPDGRLLAAGGVDGAVRVWDLASGTEVRHFTGHGSQVQALAFSPDGKRLASGSSDATALVWDTGLLLRWPLAEARSWEPTDAQWRGLGKDDPDPAARTTWALVAAGDAAVPFLRARLRPAAPPAADRVAALIDQLGCDRFADRERATNELAGLGVAVEPALRAVATTADPETRQRVDRLLARLAPTQSPDLLAAVRGIAALERIGTPAAARALKEVAADRGQHPVIVAEAEAAGRRSAARPGHAALSGS
ncbi:sigma-70 family RNA polymerase sigma factor [Fimbriiglobus ruber]|uniref:High-affnity carbon uptake protein Hat/HatR n=1 Tax=Fimbriiglobus ruber TaxID=1908690 RepID=A0A225DMZ4_9BACT|nr:sigma-70 family RNA polymerase sigma factor [Fimbriiglobus ruber]OWK37775.1 High-affnity carbon uptake protein Hat/HatR [Fimbriiglobus ruber]